MSCKSTTNAIAISISVILTFYAFRAFGQQRVIVRDWSYETPAGRLGYWKVVDYGQSPTGTDRYFFFGPLGHFSLGSSGLIVRPKPLLGIIALSGIPVAIVIGLVRRRRYGYQAAEQSSRAYGHERPGEDAS